MSDSTMESFSLSFRPTNLELSLYITQSSSELLSSAFTQTADISTTTPGGAFDNPMAYWAYGVVGLVCLIGCGFAWTQFLRACYHSCPTCARASLALNHNPTVRVLKRVKNYLMLGSCWGHQPSHSRDDIELGSEAGTVDSAESVRVVDLSLPPPPYLEALSMPRPGEVQPGHSISEFEPDTISQMVTEDGSSVSHQSTAVESTDAGELSVVLQGTDLQPRVSGASTASAVTSTEGVSTDISEALCASLGGGCVRDQSVSSDSGTEGAPCRVQQTIYPQQDCFIATLPLIGNSLHEGSSLECAQNNRQGSTEEESLNFNQGLNEDRCLNFTQVLTVEHSLHNNQGLTVEKSSSHSQILTAKNSRNHNHGLTLDSSSNSNQGLTVDSSSNSNRGLTLDRGLNHDHGLTRI